MFHDMLHLVRGIENYGAPNETILLILPRKWQEITQKRASQVSKRLSKTYLIYKAYYALARTLDHTKTKNVENDDLDMLDSEQCIVNDVVMGLKLLIRVGWKAFILCASRCSRQSGCC